MCPESPDGTILLAELDFNPGVRVSPLPMYLKSNALKKHKLPENEKKKESINLLRKMNNGSQMKHVLAFGKVVMGAITVILKPWS